MARKLSEESVCLKHRMGRCNSVASHQFEELRIADLKLRIEVIRGPQSAIPNPRFEIIHVPVVKQIITRPCEGRVPSAILGGNADWKME